ncbi:mitochondrial outer membrane protein, partial [Colletotrichum chrysophilum]
MVVSVPRLHRPTDAPALPAANATPSSGPELRFPHRGARVPSPLLLGLAHNPSSPPPLRRPPRRDTAAMPEHPPRNLFDVPAPIAALFRRFPLVTLPPNDLPIRSPPRGDIPILFVFTTDDDAPRGRPSFNPSCLKWQVSPNHRLYPLRGHS